MKKFIHKKLLIASSNKGKIKEIQELLQPLNIEVVSAADFNLPEPEENGSTFIENAEIKARYYGSKTNLPSIADDSGLCVNALSGAPGIYSARWAGENKDFTIAMQRIEKEIGNNQNKSGFFACALSLYWPEDGHIENFEGRVYGNLTFPPRGNNGFGYDPIFIANGYDKTFAEMDPNEKQKISHRADAFRKLVSFFYKK